MNGEEVEKTDLDRGRLAGYERKRDPRVKRDPASNEVNSRDPSRSCHGIQGQYPLLLRRSTWSGSIGSSLGRSSASIASCQMRDPRLS